MKRIFHILLVLGIAGAVAGCEMEHYRSDTMTSAQLKDDPSSAVYTTDGNYSLFKDIKEYRGKEDSGLTYQKIWFHMSEMRGDNAVLSGRTTSPIYESARLSDNATLKQQTAIWWLSYKIIYSANTIIESMPESDDAASNHLLGENYFLRAICHLNLSQLFSHQYSYGKDRLGVVLRTSTDCSVTTRATVSQVYDQIVSDLQDAARLMKNGTRRGDAGYASYEAARALLTRVYLYMENWEGVITLAEEMLGGDMAGKLDPSITNLYSNARNSKETLWCIANMASETVGRSSLGSMYYSPNGTGGIGWGEVYWSDPLLELMERYPEDLRYTSMCELYAAKDDGMAMVRWPMDQGAEVDWRTNNVAVDAVKNDAGNWEFTYKDTKYEVKEKVVNGYTEYYIEGYEAGQQTKVYVSANTDKVNGIRQNFPMFQMKKFSNQDGDSNLASPIMIRWGEVILNYAEALAMTPGREADAIRAVNVIRDRALIPAWDENHKWEDHGYQSVIEVVNDERRRELCFEGHRPYDVMRQRRDLDRRFTGVHPWEVVRFGEDEAGCHAHRMIYRIPYDEISVSGIPQND